MRQLQISLWIAFLSLASFSPEVSEAAKRGCTRIVKSAITGRPAPDLPIPDSWRVPKTRERILKAAYDNTLAVLDLLSDYRIDRRRNSKSLWVASAFGVNPALKRPFQKNIGFVESHLHDSAGRPQGVFVSVLDEASTRLVSLRFPKSYAIDHRGSHSFARKPPVMTFVQELMEWYSSQILLSHGKSNLKIHVNDTSEIRERILRKPKGQVDLNYTLTFLVTVSIDNRTIEFSQPVTLTLTASGKLTPSKEEAFSFTTPLSIVQADFRSIKFDRFKYGHFHEHLEENIQAVISGLRLP